MEETATKVVIFDFDDTLYTGMDWTPWVEHRLIALTKVLKGQTKEIINKVWADSVEFGDNDEATTLALKKNGFDSNLWVDYRMHNICKVMTFDNLNLISASNEELNKFAKNFTLYCVSNSAITWIEKIADITKIDLSVFKKVYGNEFVNGDVTKNYIYKKIIKDENISPKELFVIGNSQQTDVGPAYEVGARGQIVSSSQFSLEDFNI